MSSLSATRLAVRSTRASGLPRLAGGPVANAPARSLSMLSSAPRSHFTPRMMVPCVSARGLMSTPSRWLRDTTPKDAASKDQTWLSKGPVRYAELKPETEAPSGDITVIDVREPAEVAQGIIPSAVNVPLSQFEQAFAGDGGDFIRNFAFNRPGYDDKIVFYCRSGKRSQQATEFAQKKGWWNTRNYEGSWLDWVQQEEANRKGSEMKEDDD